MDNSNPFTKFARPGTQDKGTDNPFEKYKKPTMIQNTNRGDWATLPEPHEGMFSDMEDADAKIYHDAYARHPDTKTVYDPETKKPILVYKGKPVPEPEGNSPLVDMYTKSVGYALNPGQVGAEIGIWAGNKARSAFGKEEDLKPPLKAPWNPQEALAGGAINTVRNNTELGGALVDYGMHSTGLSDVKDTPTLDAARELPSYNPEGAVAHGMAATGEIGLGMLGGDKIHAALKLAKVAPKAAEAFTKFVPKFVDAIAKTSARVFAQSGGIATSVHTGSDKLMTGDEAPLPIFKGLDTKTEDEAYNVIADRVNAFIDAAVTAYPIETVAGGVKMAWSKYVKVRLVDPMKALVSGKAREDAFTEEVMNILGQYTGKESVADKEELHKALLDVFKRHDQHYVTKELGIQGIPDEKIPLDTGTFVKRELSGSDNPVDEDMAAGFEALRNRTISEEGHRTKRAFEGVESGLKKTLRESEQLFGANNAVNRGRENVQALAEKELSAAKADSELGMVEARDTANRIAGNTSDAMQARRKIKNEKFEAIDPDREVPADMKSFGSVYNQAKPAMSKELRESIEESKGSFGELYTEIRPRIQREIDLARHEQRFDDANSLRALKKNIEEAQPKYISENRSNTGKFKRSEAETAQKADEAMKYYKEEYTPYKQGPSNEILDLADKNRFKPDDFAAKSRNVVDRTIKEVDKNPEHYTRLKKLLETEEGGKSSELLRKYADAKDKEAAFKEIQAEIYEGKFKDFYKRRGITTKNGTASFKKLLNDPEGGETIDALLKENDPVIRDAMKSVWSDMMHSSGFKGQYTNLGTEKFTNSNEDRRTFMEFGRKIFDDSPKFMDFIEHMTDLASDAAKSRTFSKAGSGITSNAEKEAGRAGRQVIAAQAGRLSVKATRENVIFDMILKARGMNTAMKQIADKAMANPKEMERLLKNWNPKKQGTTARDVFKFLVESNVLNESDRNKLKKEFEKLNTGMQFDEYFGRDRKKTLLEEGVDLGTDVVKGVGKLPEQIKKAFYGDESK